MTTLIQDIQALLETLEPAGGVWHGANTTGEPVYPFIVWSRVSSPSNVSLGGPSDLQNTRIQIDLFDRNVGALDTLAKALDAAMAAWSVQNVRISTFDSYEEPVRAFRVSKDFSVWARN